MGIVKIIPIFLILSLSVGLLFGQGTAPKMSEADEIAGMAMIARLGAKKPFLNESSDVLLEPQSMNKFFTDKIYQRLEGNAYFGYRWDEGFTCPGNEVSIEELLDLTEKTAAAYRFALELALGNYQINPGAVCQIGLAIVGAEAVETERTLPGVMVEAYLRNTTTKKSFFVRYGAGSPRGLAAAIRLSAEMVVSVLEALSGSWEE
jgi:hypothetical protein